MENDPEQPPVFRHPQWMVGIVLILGVASLIAGLNDPIWWLIGAPCILTLLVWIWVRVVAGR